MSTLFELIQGLEDNLKADCCISKLTINASELRIKLYQTIGDACEENENHKWYNFNDVAIFNNNIERPTGIVSHKCECHKCIISLIIDKSENTRFCVVGNVELKIKF